VLHQARDFAASCLRPRDQIGGDGGVVGGEVVVVGVVVGVVDRVLKAAVVVAVVVFVGIVIAAETGGIYPRNGGRDGDRR
jgi:hypothetical protein